jgi:hypothetical protein
MPVKLRLSRPFVNIVRPPQLDLDLIPDPMDLISLWRDHHQKAK